MKRARDVSFAELLRRMEEEEAKEDRIMREKESKRRAELEEEFARERKEWKQKQMERLDQDIQNIKNHIVMEEKRKKEALQVLQYVFPVVPQFAAVK